MRKPKAAGQWRVCMWVLTSALVACGGASPTDPGGLGGGCGLGSISVVPTPGEPPCAVTPQCPRVRPATAQTLIAVATCGFGRDASSCTPVPVPGGPRLQRVQLHFLLANPDRPGSVCTANVDVVADATPDGGAGLRWEAQELEDAAGGGCRNAGAQFAGTATVEGTCCERAVDIVLPVAQRTFRIRVRTDWQ